MLVDGCKFIFYRSRIGKSFTRDCAYYSHSESVTKYTNDSRVGSFQPLRYTKNKFHNKFTYNGGSIWT